MKTSIFYFEKYDNCHRLMLCVSLFDINVLKTLSVYSSETGIRTEASWVKQKSKIGCKNSVNNHV